MYKHHVILTTVLRSRGCGTDVTFKRFINLPVISPVRGRRGICCLHTTDWAATTIDVCVSVLELRHPRSRPLVGAPSWLVDSCLLAVASNYLPQCVHKGRDFSLPLLYKDTNLLTRAPPPRPCPNLITSHRPTTVRVRTSTHRFGEQKPSVHDTRLATQTFWAWSHAPNSSVTIMHYCCCYYNSISKFPVP